MIPRHSPSTIAEMRPVGAFVASVLTTLQSQALAGVNLLELDAQAHRMIKEVGAESCYIDYHPSFGRSLSAKSSAPLSMTQPFMDSPTITSCRQAISSRWTLP